MKTLITIICIVVLESQDLFNMLLNNPFILLIVIFLEIMFCASGLIVRTVSSPPSNLSQTFTLFGSDHSSLS